MKNMLPFRFHLSFRTRTWILPSLFLFLTMITGGCSHSGQPDAGGSSDEFWGHRFVAINDVPYGDSEEQKMDFYCQGQWVGEPWYWQFDSVTHPTLIYFHGGGWISNNKHQAIPFIIPFMQKGWNVVSVEYRKGEGTAPAAVLDCLEAVTWITAHADEYRIDTGMMVLSGESAGGHLALITGVLTNLPHSDAEAGKANTHIKTVINWYGISDIKKAFDYLTQYKPDWNYALKWMGTEARLDSLSPVYSPMQRLTSSAPAVISIHGTVDSVVPHQQSVDLHKRLDELGIRNRLVSLEGGKHLGFRDQQFQAAFQSIFDFLKTSAKNSNN